MLNSFQERFEAMEREPRLTETERAVLTAMERKDWKQVRVQLSAMEQPMDREVSEFCLQFALESAPLAVFAALLDHAPKGEFAGSVIVRGLPGGFAAEISGTLVTLAAALGKASQLRCLLDRGWDVNSASPDAAHCLQHASRNMDPHYRWGTERFEPFAARPESQLRILLDEEDMGGPPLVRQLYTGVTPLAAALMCGRAECAQILMDRGAWKEKAPSVARALMQRGREDANYRACREAVLTDGNAPQPMALWAVVRSCSVEQLEAELERCAYGDEEIAKAVWELCSSYRYVPSRGPWAEERQRDLQRVRVLERYAPQVLHRPELVSLLLRWVMILNGGEEYQDFLLTLCPERVDLSLLREGLIRMPARKTSDFLRRVCEGRTCVMDRDSVPPTTPVLVLQTLLRSVEFLPPMSDQSVSGLTYAILHSGNLRLIQKALRTGAIPPEEPTELLLRCLTSIPWASAARTLLLTVPRPERKALGGDHRKQISDGPMFRWLPTETRESGYRLLLESDCSETLEREVVMRGLYDYRRQFSCETEEGLWKLDSLLPLLCRKGNRQAVERWVRCAPKGVVGKSFTLSLAGEAYSLKATPLCTAAFAGQRDVVEALLAFGADPNEEQLGMPSTLLCQHEEQDLALTPVLAAMARGHREIVRLLLEHGAVLDPRQEALHTLWRYFHGEDRLEVPGQYLKTPILRPQVSLTA